jgi:hypothetical protein
VKKCASCTKDLPDAALHCVFCGAKQPPAPVQHPGMAKTAFGYSPNDLEDSVRTTARQAGFAPTAAFHPQGGPAPAPSRASAASSMAGLPPMPPPRSTAPVAPIVNATPNPIAIAPTMLPPAPPVVPPPPAPPPGTPYRGGPQPSFAPASNASAKTMFVQASPGPVMPPSPAMPTAASAYPPPQNAMAATLVPQSSVMPAAMAQTVVPTAGPATGRAMQPIMAIPAAQPPPYLASQTASRLIRPIEPWRDGLRAWMFLAGLGLLAAFATPLASSPARFNWTAILDGQGAARLPPLVLAAVGLLSIVFAIVPMPVAPRGLIATLLGVAGIGVPIAIAGLPPWLVLVPLGGMLVLVPGLLARDEYRDALIPRLVVTLGAGGVLLPFLLPQNDAIPLVSVFKHLIDLPGAQKVEPALTLGMITIVVMSLLAWLPAPVTGGAKVWAWLLILWALIAHVILLVVHGVIAGGLGGALTSAPNATLLGWVASGGGTIGSAYLVIIGYGLASVIGKQLE